MEIKKAKELALQLMQEHNLTEWKFDFNRRKSALGLCSYTNKTIYLSHIFTILNDEQTIKNTILHEIAHALCPRGTGHSRRWKEKAEEIGSIPTRVTTNCISPQYSFIYECKNCGIEIPRNKHTKRTACGICCKKLNNGKYSEKYIITLKRMGGI
jgi:predicted SprT family Zn-dependent metalloprotease